MSLGYQVQDKNLRCIYLTLLPERKGEREEGRDQEREEKEGGIKKRRSGLKGGRK